ncbi:hypothetical protein BT96DRAFT_461073 [Gymnopus androsaceus JB14]|uniref:Uncharacterized protein n=1 Tax=Gymnopus androsaceus JB14 TaxID=1447944 RepID=A0A6A4IH32_9AGAR|nr:hypothetical protein BT96DRAFT_461073 [Gymnopus androsaceus JB14]
MSFARQALQVGLSSRFRLASSSPLPSVALRSALIQPRLLHSSQCSHAAEPSHNHDHGTERHTEHLHSDMKLLHGRYPERPLYADLDSNVDHLKTGERAIDKAVHLFFLTEIMRGA